MRREEGGGRGEGGGGGGERRGRGVRVWMWEKMGGGEGLVEGYVSNVDNLSFHL